ncbi:MAG: hypothetical protein FWD57_01305, partial [Polyangiaceae bacterium]|nr:hypothetical protein [Polyangiaceae bacterium]
MPPIDASVVIVPYIEPVIKGRRVAVLGDATLQIGEAILERGARLVHVYDPNVARVAEVLARRGASRTLMTAPLPDGDLAVRDGAFDAIVVPNLTLFDPVDAIVARARKLVSAHGCAVFLSPNPAANPDSVDPLLSYYELYDLVALQFPEVRMLGQAPFAGYVVADLAPESDPDVVVDTSLMGKPVREPLWFIALGTQQPKRLDPFTIIQVPQSFEATPEGSETVSRLRQQIICLEKSLAEAQTLAVQVVPLAQPANDRADALEATLRERDEELRRAESRAGDNHVRAGRLETKVRDLEEELRNQRDRAFRLSNDLEEEKKLRTKADLELRMVRSRADMPPVQDSAKIAEIERLRSALAQADSKLHSLETDLANIKSRAANAQRQLSAAEDALEDLTAAKKQSDVRLATLQRIVTEKDARIARLDAEIVDYQENAVDPAVEQELAATQKAFDELQTAFDEL